MTTLATDTPRDFEIGDRNEFPVIASEIIYEGAAVGLVAASGHVQPLTSSDIFVGFAEKQADNSSGDAADINVRVIKKGSVKLAVTGAVITDINLPVYAADDNTFSFIKTSGVFVGFSRRYVSSGYMIVEFDAGVLFDPHEGLTARTVATATTLAVADTGKVVFVTADAGVLTMPAIVGLKVRVVNGGAYGTVLVTISPNASDAIQATGTTATADKDLLNTKATACRGDFVDLEYGDANGWIVTQSVGIWVKE